MSRPKGLDSSLQAPAITSLRVFPDALQTADFASQDRQVVARPYRSALARKSSRHGRRRQSARSSSPTSVRNRSHAEWKSWNAQQSVWRTPRLSGFARSSGYRRSGGVRRSSSKRASIELSFHSLRHTAVSLFKDAAVPDSVVQALVGHESAAMSRRYTHVGKEALSRATDSLPEI